MPVTAFKKGRKQVFSDLCWALLGSNKEGWIEVPVQQVVNEVKIEPPYMGPPINKTQVVNNELGKTEEELQEVVEPKVIKVEPEKKETFLKALEGLSKSRIKEYFELQKPAVKYDNKAAISDLKNQLAEHLNYDLVKFQKSFA